MTQQESEPNIMSAKTTLFSYNKWNTDEQETSSHKRSQVSSIQQRISQQRGKLRGEKYNDAMKEDLRCRLALIRSSILRKASDDEYQDLMAALSWKALSIFTQLARMASTLSWDKMQEIIKESYQQRLSEKKYQKVVLHLDTLLQEFKHFLTINNLVKD